MPNGDGAVWKGERVRAGWSSAMPEVRPGLRVQRDGFVLDNRMDLSCCRDLGVTAWGRAGGVRAASMTLLTAVLLSGVGWGGGRVRVITANGHRAVRAGRLELQGGEGGIRGMHAACRKGSAVVVASRAMALGENRCVGARGVGVGSGAHNTAQFTGLVCLLASYCRPPSPAAPTPQVLMGHLYERHDGRPPHMAIVAAGMVSSSIAQVGAREGSEELESSMNCKGRAGSETLW